MLAPVPPLRVRFAVPGVPPGAVRRASVPAPAEAENLLPTHP
jgi:hypothetical protein